MVAEVTAVVFDYYGTLAPGRDPLFQRAARAEQAAALDVDVEAYDAMLTATHRERFGGVGGTLEGSMRWMLEQLGVDREEAVVRQAAQIRLASERRFGEPRPEAEPTLRALHGRGLRIGVISDCSAELPLYFGELPLARWVDTAVFSFVTGHCKPAPENYLAACAALGVEPADALYVGDGASNELHGARAVGMRPVHLAVPDEADAVAYGRHESWDGETIAGLKDVLDLV